MYGKKSALSTLPVSLQVALVGELDGELASIEFRVSDTVDDDDRAGWHALAQAYSDMVGAITSCLGFPPSGGLWGSAGVKWDLANGGRVNLPQGLSALLVEVWSKQLADVERLQISQGVDPEHRLDDVD